MGFLDWLGKRPIDGSKLPYDPQCEIFRQTKPCRKHQFKMVRGQLGPKYGSACEVCKKCCLHRHHSHKRGVPFRYRFYAPWECRYW